MVFAGLIVFSLGFVGAYVSRRNMVRRQKFGETLASPGMRRGFIIFIGCIAVQLAGFAAAFAAAWFGR